MDQLAYSEPSTSTELNETQIIPSPEHEIALDCNRSTTECETLPSASSVEKLVNEQTLLEETIASVSSVENLINRRRLVQFRRFTRKLIETILEQDFEYGYDSEADKLVRENMKKNEAATKAWLNEIFYDNFDIPPVVIGILQVISHIEYSDIKPEGPTIAMAALSHQDSEVKECAIRAFENWATPDSLLILRQLDNLEDWLQEYLEQVICDLEGESR